MRGFTLIELILTVSIIAFLSLIGITRFNQLRQDSVMNSTVDEFISQVRSARNMSMAGEVLEGETIDDFEEDGLPLYGVSVTTGSYELYRDYIAKGDTVETRQSIAATNLNSDMTISGSTEVEFERISGDTAGASFIFEKAGIAEKKQVDITSDGVIKKSKV
jgi:prepilin-type N-terminal cleavage/methylation domain-containing protein